MKANLDRRLKALEAAAGPRVISTLADFVMWCAEDDPDENIELTPEMQEFIDETLKHIEEENKDL